MGITAGGLSSFVSSNDNEVSDQEEETVTAGMELSVAGTQIRPFVFFTGQGELMGHVWSGTASEMTPAFQVSSCRSIEYLKVSFFSDLGINFTSRSFRICEVKFRICSKI